MTADENRPNYGEEEDAEFHVLILHSQTGRLHKVTSLAKPIPVLTLAGFLACYGLVSGGPDGFFKAIRMGIPEIRGMSLTANPTVRDIGSPQ